MIFQHVLMYETWLLIIFLAIKKSKTNKKEQQKKQRNKMTNIKPRKTNRNTGMELNTLELLMSKESPLSALPLSLCGKLCGYFNE